MAIFSGSMMDDILMGTMEDDVLWGGMGDDTLQGGDGNDRLSGGPGGDKLDGGPGDMDIASYTQSPSGVHVSLSTSFTGNVDERPAIRGGDAEGDALTGIEFIWGSAFGDILLGNHSPNSLFGNAGDDILHGGGGNDLLRGGPDNDRLGGTAVAQGDGTVVGTDEEGDDTLYGDEGNDQLKGGTGNDMLFGGMGNDELLGGAGHDYLEGGPGADELVGGPGMDTAGYTMSPEAVMVDLRHPIPGVTSAPMGGDAMGDTLMEIENLRGSMYDDMLTGDNPPAEDDPATTADETKAGNKLFGNMGDDMLKGMGGDDTLHGGKGMDTLYGGMGDDELMGEMGDDVLKGQEGDDTLTGGPGADKLFGGTVNADGDPVPDEAGMDTADYSKSDAGVKIDLSATSRITGRSEPSAEGGHAEGDTLHDIQNVTGSAHTDYLVGDEGPNVLMGMDGDDMDDDSTPRVTEGGLKGMGGNDVLSGGGGMDELDGGAGMDDLWGGDGDDMLKGGAGNDAPFYIANVDNSDPTDGDFDDPEDQAANARVTGIDAARLMDPSPARAAAALEAMNIQRAGLFGGSGDDTLEGGTGRDYLHGGFGNDTATYANSAAGVAVNIGETVNLNAAEEGNSPDTTDPGEMAGATGTTDTDGDAGTTNTAADGEGAPEELVSIENLIGSDYADILVGSKGANTLSGGKVGDMLYGQGGNDVLMGGDGADTLTGGTGSDTFVFGRERVTDDTADAADPADDVVMDFSKSGGDKIDLTALDLSAAELAAIIAAANAGGTEGTGTNVNRYTYILDLTPETGETDGANYGARDIRITMSERFVELDADDFII